MTAPTLTGSRDGPHTFASNAPLALASAASPEGRPMTSAGRSATALPLVVRTARSERAAAPSPSFAPLTRHEPAGHGVLLSLYAVGVRTPGSSPHAARRLHVGRAPGWLAVHLCGLLPPSQGRERSDVVARGRRTGTEGTPVSAASSTVSTSAPPPPVTPTRPVPCPPPGAAPPHDSPSPASSRASSSSGSPSPSPSSACTWRSAFGEPGDGKLVDGNPTERWNAPANREHLGGSLLFSGPAAPAAGSSCVAGPRPAAPAT